MNDYQLADFELARINFESQLMGSQDNYYPNICDIHDAFESMQEESSRHNCIGCNFADSVWLVKYFFDRVHTYESIHDAYFEYIFRLYLIVERMNEIFSIIELPEKYRLKHFNTVREIHKWANFVKHPKAFIYTHHPVFAIEGEDMEPNTNSQIIDSDFVQKYYSGMKRNKELFKKLSNNKAVIVKFPKPSALIGYFSNELCLFKNVICNNDVYKEILSEHSSYELYFEEMDE